MAVPLSLAAGGRALWEQITEAHELDAAQLVQLEEACRAKDRLDKLHLLLAGDADAWGRVTRCVPGEGFDVVVDDALSKANATANLMKQLLAALRLPDAVTGRRPQYRGPRGVQRPSLPGGKVSSLDRARQGHPHHPE